MVYIPLTFEAPEDVMRILGLTLLAGLMACDDKDPEPVDTGSGDTGPDTEPVIDADADGYSAEEDCDDNSASINPGAPEVCDGIDNNCDGQIDEGATTTYYTDRDGDGHGDDKDTTEACDQPSGTVAVGGDCDDYNASVNPDEKEVCDTVDNNCDGQIDEGLTITVYPDSDGDGFGTDGTSFEVCSVGVGYAEQTGDCDDTNATVFPGNTETCDGIDSDCDKTTVDPGIIWTDGSTAVDISAEFAAGTATAPAEITLSDAGDIYICSGTFYVDIDIEADVNLYGEGSGQTILSGGGVSTVLNWPTNAVISTVEDVTITGGIGHIDSSISTKYTLGGASRCSSGSTVSMNNVVFSNNDAGIGGAIFVNGCTMDFTESELHTNTATFGGGLFIYTGAVTFIESEIWGNVVSTTGGGVAMEGYYGTATLDLIDTLVTQNEAYYGAGLSAIYDSTITCEGTNKGVVQAGVTDNYNSSGLYGGGLVTYYEGYTASVTVDNCDFGSSKTSDDNDPNDVYSIDQSEEYADYGAGASFTCDYYGCE